MAISGASSSVHQELPTSTKATQPAANAPTVNTSAREYHPYRRFIRPASAIRWDSREKSLPRPAARLSDSVEGSVVVVIVPFQPNGVGADSRAAGLLRGGLSLP